jgi:hypothetical protein
LKTRPILLQKYGISSKFKDKISRVVDAPAPSSRLAWQSIAFQNFTYDRFDVRYGINCT